MRNQIIEELKHGLEDDPAVFALWLEGADSLGTVDEFSDIDVVADVKDGEEGRILERIEKLLKELGDVDLNWEAPRPHPKLRYKIFHIADTSEHLLIDVTIQSHSREFRFIENDRFEKPFVLFDKEGVIVYQKLDAGEVTRNQAARISDLKALFFQRSKVRKYISRKNFLEALAYYRKAVLDPLIQLLRLKYTPSVSEYGAVHISRHLPKEVLIRLEELHKVGSLADLEKLLPKAETWFNSLLQEIQSH